MRCRKRKGREKVGREVKQGEKLMRKGRRSMKRCVCVSDIAEDRMKKRQESEDEKLRKKKKREERKLERKKKENNEKSYEKN